MVQGVWLVHLQIVLHATITNWPFVAVMCMELPASITWYQSSSRAGLNLNDGVLFLRPLSAIFFRVCAVRLFLSKLALCGDDR